MKLLKNRTVLGVLCIAVSLLICFAVTPLVNAGLSQKTTIVRFVKDVKAGEEIKKGMLQEVEVGGYNLPENVLRSITEAEGKYLTADVYAGDYIVAEKVADEPAAENKYLYNLNGEKQAISITISSFAEGLSGKLKSGDIVSVIAPDYLGSGETVIPAELKYVEVIAVTAKSGYDANTQEQEEEKELPSTVTVLVRPEQSRLLARLEAEGEIHLSLVYRGDSQKAAQFIEAQDLVLEELLEETTEEEEVSVVKNEVPRTGGEADAVTAEETSADEKNDTDMEEEMPEEGGVLAVWGSPSSGKTVVSVKLAEHLAKKKRNVILILADMITPPLPYLCAPSDIEQERSLGSILAASHVTENLIKKNCMFYRKNDYLSMVGMLKGENVFTYPPYEKEQAAELIQLAAQIAPYVIVDCTSNIASDILSAVALMEADTVLRLAGCDLKSISYLSSQLPLLSDHKWDADKQLKAVSNIRQQEASSHMEQILGSVSFQIPHSSEVEAQFLEGELLGELGLKESRTFRREIEKISREVFGV